jgi:hypothetical protein
VEADILLEIRTDPLPSSISLSSISAFGLMLKVKFRKNDIVISDWLQLAHLLYVLEFSFIVSTIRQLFFVKAKFDNLTILNFYCIFDI